MNQPALAVENGPRSVQAARHWVVHVLHDLGRPECVEAAELAVSELVTNAVLHAEPPISVVVRGTRSHPRVEVRDGSLEPPELPQSREIDEDTLLATYGRGLDIVARCADAWGAEIEESGKTVWFTPATETRERGVAGAISGLSDATNGDQVADTIPLHLLGTPVDSVSDFEQHFRELRREMRLLTLAHPDDYPFASRLADMFGSLQRELRHGLDCGEIREAHQSGREDLDLTVRLSRATAESMGEFVELLDRADEFCAQHRMRSLVRTPQQRSFQTWLLTDILRQASGQAPTPYAEASSLRAQA